MCNFWSVLMDTLQANQDMCYYLGTVTLRNNKLYTTVNYTPEKIKIYNLSLFCSQVLVK